MDMSAGNAYSHLYVECTSEKEAEDVKKLIEEARLFCTRVEVNTKKIGNPVNVYILLFDSEVGFGFNEELKNLYKDILEKTGKRIEGYLIVEDFEPYRVEFDKDGALQEEWVGWLEEYPIWAIRQIRAYAEDLVLP